MAERMDLRKEMCERLATPSKYAGLGAAIADWFLVWHWNHLSHFGSGRFELLCWSPYKWQMRLPPLK